MSSQLQFQRDPSTRTLTRVGAACAAIFPLMLLAGGLVAFIGSPVGGAAVTGEELLEWNLNREFTIETGQMIVFFAVFPMVGLFAVLTPLTRGALSRFGVMCGGLAAALVLVSAAVKTEPASMLGFFENASDPDGLLAFLTVSVGHHLDVGVDHLAAVGLAAGAISLHRAGVISPRMRTTIVVLTAVTLLLVWANIGRIGLVVTALTFAVALWRSPAETLSER